MSDRETEQIMARIPIALRNEYAAAWEAYQTACTTRDASQETRSATYERARKVEERHNAAAIVARSELQREEQRKKTSTPA